MTLPPQRRPRCWQGHAVPEACSRPRPRPRLRRRRPAPGRKKARRGPGRCRLRPAVRAAAVRDALFRAAGAPGTAKARWAAVARARPPRRLSPAPGPGRAVCEAGGHPRPRSYCIHSSKANNVVWAPSPRPLLRLPRAPRRDARGRAPTRPRGRQPGDLPQAVRGVRRTQPADCGLLRGEEQACRGMLCRPCSLTSSPAESVDRHQQLDRRILRTAAGGAAAAERVAVLRSESISVAYLNINHCVPCLCSRVVPCSLCDLPTSSLHRKICRQLARRRARRERPRVPPHKGHDLPVHLLHDRLL